MSFLKKGRLVICLDLTSGFDSAIDSDLDCSVLVCFLDSLVNNVEKILLVSCFCSTAVSFI